MAMTPGKNSNGSMEDHAAAGAPKPTKTVISASRPARAANVVDDAVSMAEDERGSMTAGGLPERKYSFNALLAMGLVGFVIGRICSR